MFEKVNPCHPDKVADRIAGAIVDLAYKKNENAKMACEVLLGHGLCTIITETSEHITYQEVQDIVFRLAGQVRIIYSDNQQDPHLANNQSHEVRCGDNGIFKGTPVTYEQGCLTSTASLIYHQYPTDGKYIQQGKKLIICQSCAKTSELQEKFPEALINPLGDWTGGPDVDAGATNRKLGSDMGDGVTGGGLHGKDLSKADVSLNIYCYLKAQELLHPVSAHCAIGDNVIYPTVLNGHGIHEPLNPVTYAEVVSIARGYIAAIGGFEKFAEWGLIRPVLQK